MTIHCPKKFRKEGPVSSSCVEIESNQTALRNSKSNIRSHALIPTIIGPDSTCRAEAREMRGQAILYLHHRSPTSFDCEQYATSDRLLRMARACGVQFWRHRLPQAGECIRLSDNGQSRGEEDAPSGLTCHL